MSRWFRFYDEVVNDPKVQRLPGEVFKAWVNLLCIASSNGGSLPPIPDVAFSLRKSEQETSELLGSLQSLGLLDETDGGIIPHNWKNRQFKSDVSTERVKRFRNGQRGVSETPPDTETEQIQNRKDSGARAPDDWPVDATEQFWNDYPHKIGKSAAIAKLGQVRKRGVSWKVLMDGLRRYKLTKPADRPWCNPLTWLNQGRWEDAPAEAAQLQSISDRLSEEDALKHYVKTGHWSRWSPCAEPGQTGCTIPPEMFAKYGLLPDGRKAA